MACFYRRSQANLTVTKRVSQRLFHGQKILGRLKRGARLCPIRHHEKTGSHQRLSLQMRRGLHPSELLLFVHRITTLGCNLWPSHANSQSLLRWLRISAAREKHSVGGWAWGRIWGRFCILRICRRYPVLPAQSPSTDEAPAGELYRHCLRRQILDGQRFD